MNHSGCSNSQGGLRFITAFLAEYEPATRTVPYINAGHNQPLLRRTSGRIERLDMGGGEERLISVMHAGADTSPATMLGRTMADLDQFVGNAPQHDDVTCLLLKAL